MQLLDTLARLGTAPRRPAALATVQGRSARFDIHLDDAAAPAVQALVQARYVWRGYRTGGAPDARERLTLSARAGRDTVGTLSVAFDGPAGLGADAAFAHELQALRRARWRLCEFTQLAVDTADDSAALLAGLFHVAFVAAHRLRAAGMLLLEVHPRHVAWYERLLGCRALAPARTNPRVQAPAVLLAAEAAPLRQQLSTAARARPAFFRRGFSADEENLILSRLLMCRP